MHVHPAKKWNIIRCWLVPQYVPSQSLFDPHMFHVVQHNSGHVGIIPSDIVKAWSHEKRGFLKTFWISKSPWVSICFIVKSWLWMTMTWMIWGTHDFGYLYIIPFNPILPCSTPIFRGRTPIFFGTCISVCLKIEYPKIPWRIIISLFLNVHKLG